MYSHSIFLGSHVLLYTHFPIILFFLLVCVYIRFDSLLVGRLCNQFTFTKTLFVSSVITHWLCSLITIQLTLIVGASYVLASDSSGLFLHVVLVFLNDADSVLYRRGNRRRVDHPVRVQADSVLFRGHYLHDQNV